MTSDRKVIVLGLALVVTAAFGVRSLLAGSGGATESGFDGVDPFPLTTTADPVEPVEIRPAASPRNPFVQIAGGGETPSTESDGDTGDGADDPGEVVSGTDDAAPGTAPATGATATTPAPSEPAGNDVVPTEPLDEADLRRSDDTGDDTDSNGRGR